MYSTLFLRLLLQLFFFFFEAGDSMAICVSLPAPPTASRGHGVILPTLGSKRMKEEQAGAPHALPTLTLTVTLILNRNKDKNSNSNGSKETGT